MRPDAAGVSGPEVRGPEVRVSALVSAYYCAPFLEGRLDNLAAQSPAPEILVVCQAGSVEATIAARWFTARGEKDHILFTTDIPSVYAAWNLAIVRAHGEYLTNANSDDRLKPDGLARLVAALDQHPEAAVAYGDCEIVKALGGPVVGEFRWAEGGHDALLRGCFVGPMPLWRKRLHDRYGLFDETLLVAGDYEFWLRITAGGERLLHVPEIVGTYWQREANAPGGASREHREPLRTTWETARVRAKYREVGRGGA